MAAAVPRARLSRIAGAGHLAPVEQPEAVTAEVVAFLREAAP
jgi:pimeloyl-ACP methyl ester carboxylesterase